MKKNQTTSIPSDNKTPHTATRRRGDLLEEAILLAAWNELSEVGYNQLTMEGVAARAETNKAVLYRRWSNKSELVIAALRKYLPALPKEIPNTGNLRNDIFSYLHTLAKPLQEIEAQTIRGIMTEHLGGTLIASLPQVIKKRTDSKLTAAIIVILRNAELRGEVSLEKLSMRIISLPVDLLRYELITIQEPVSDETITEIVDNIFLPLVHAQSGIIK
ncbi:MAG: TetR/AcrR family transcriptional regulator [Anaerocolumna sp.]